MSRVMGLMCYVTDEQGNGSHVLGYGEWKRISCVNYW